MVQPKGRAVERDREAEARSLTLDIYDSVLDQGRWPELLERVARHCGACGAFIFELAGDGSDRAIRAPWFSTSYKPDMVRDYLARFNLLEMADQEKFALHSRSTDGIELIRDDVLAGSETELLQRPNARYMMEQGIRYRVGALLNKDQIDVDRVAFQFTERHGPPRPDELQRANDILPHIAKALSVHRPVRQVRETLDNALAGLDRLKVGLCLIDARARIVHRNAEFRRQMEAYRVFQSDPQGRLVIASNEARSKFGAYLADVANHGKAGARPRKEAVEAQIDGEAFQLCIEVTPITRGDLLGGRGFSGHVIYSLDTRLPYEIDTDMLSRMFALTPTESEILDLVAKGLTNQQISDQRSKSVETINTQVKSILSKTGSSNRTQLIRLATNISTQLLLDPA